MIEFIKSNSDKILIENSFDAKIEIELILQSVLKCNKVDLYTKFDLVPNKKQLKIISNYINRIQSGEPVQYVLRQAPFYGRSFFVDENVLIPRFDSELIIEVLKTNKRSNSLLEIGTGSGNLAITIEKEKLANNILATDISENKLSIAKYNKKKISPKSKIKFIIDDFLNSQITRRFDVIVSNPPYIPKNQISKLDSLVRENEPINALTDGSDGYVFYEQFALYGKEMLKENGFMLLEIGVDNKPDRLHSIFDKYKLEFHNDLNKIPRVIKVY